MSLEDKESCEVVKRLTVKVKKYVLSSTWALKRKRFPDGQICKYNAKYRVQGNARSGGEVIDCKDDIHSFPCPWTEDSLG
mmetsp:Transcript_9806/g.12147  ORF Transcript_9806/g.12147 Transcript_9806/m.12147 type:complete len:80 (+) Transcript_9806:231-470(+)